LTARRGAANMAAHFRGFAVRHVMPDRAIALLLCAVVSLAACGWRLQGAAKLSPTMAVTFLDADDRYTEFNRALRDRLLASGAKVTERGADATAVVKIIKDQSGQRVLSVSARNTPEEYEVFYTVEYSVASGGTELIPPQKLELTRDYSYDTTAVLAKQREQAVLREALAQDLAGLVLRRLASL
jgi:LPS-assembly lipoprotein